MVLSRYSRETDILFGITTSGRPPTLKGAESMIGLFINTLPLRVQVAGNTPLLHWLTELQKRVVNIRQYEYTHLAKIQEWSSVPGGQPLFESLVVFENYPVARSMQERWHKLEISDVRFAEQGNYPLNLLVAPGLHLTLHLLYDHARIADETVTHLLAHLHNVLLHILGAPEQLLSAISLLDEVERVQVLDTWNRTQGDVPDPSCFHQLFSAQAALTPHAPAVQQDRHMLTYQQLDTRSNQLAHLLRQQGVGPDTIIALCLPRGLELPLALLAIWKAGAAYLPLDSALPPQRLSFLLQDAAASLLLTHSSLLSSLPASLPTVLCLDQLAFDEQPSWPPVSTVQPLHLAYLIYTSGSTGLPKGTMITHQGLRNLVEAQRHFFSLGSEERILQFASLSFDASVWELALAWGAGACLVFPSASALLAGPALGTLLVQQRISVVTLPPSILASLAGMPLPLLRLVITAGEACAWELVARWSEGRRFCNAYGPTETTVCASAAWCLTPVDRRTEGSSPPIGYPLRNLRCYVLDSNMEPAPLGVCGELYVGGPALARGYWGQPRLTAECFVPDPFSQQAGARLYRTGDLVCRREDGQLAFVGRRDQQIKLHGLRIELGEIAAVLRSHPGIQDVVVRVEGAASGGLQVVSYVIAGAQQDLNGSQVRRFVQQRLPAYMVPTRVMMLEAFPLTPNGKIDSKQLSLLMQDTQEYVRVAPRNQSEELLVNIWRALLKKETVGVHDNFFELGGDSIQCIFMVDKARKAGIHITPQQIFSYPTIAQLARVVEQSARVDTAQEPLTGDVPLTPIQHWFFERKLAQPQHWNQSMLLEGPTTFSPAHLQQIIEQLMLHHDALRMRFRQENGHWQQFYSLPNTDVPYMSIDISMLSESERQNYMKHTFLQQQASLHLEKGPLVRFVHFYQGKSQPCRLFIVIHHLVIDTVSWSILLDEIETACAQLLRGERIVFDPKTTSFKHWAELLQEYARSQHFIMEAAYWLEEARMRVERLPRDLSTSGQTTGSEASSRTIVAVLTPEETQRLQEAAQAYRAASNELVLTALALALARWTGTSQLLIALEGHGREELSDQLGFSRSLGWYTTLFPLLLQIEKADEPGTCLQMIKEQRRAVPGRGISYGLLRYLHDDPVLTERLRTLPTPEILFNYLGRIDHASSTESMFSPVGEESECDHHPENTRSHLFEINAYIIADRLEIHWTYSNQAHHERTVRKLLEDTLEHLRALMAQRWTEEAVTPSDFPLAKLNRQKLQTLSRLIEQIEDEHEKR